MPLAPTAGVASVAPSDAVSVNPGLGPEYYALTDSASSHTPSVAASFCPTLDQFNVPTHAALYAGSGNDATGGMVAIEAGSGSDHTTLWQAWDPNRNPATAADRDRIPATAADPNSIPASASESEPSEASREMMWTAMSEATASAAVGSSVDLFRPADLPLPPDRRRDRAGVVLCSGDGYLVLRTPVTPRSPSPTTPRQPQADDQPQAVDVACEPAIDEDISLGDSAHRDFERECPGRLCPEPQRAASVLASQLQTIQRTALANARAVMKGASDADVQQLLIGAASSADPAPFTPQPHAGQVPTQQPAGHNPSQPHAGQEPSSEWGHGYSRWWQHGWWQDWQWPQRDHQWDETRTWDGTSPNTVPDSEEDDADVAASEPPMGMSMPFRAVPLPHPKAQAYFGTPAEWLMVNGSGQLVDAGGNHCRVDAYGRPTRARGCQGAGSKARAAQSHAARAAAKHGRQPQASNVGRGPPSAAQPKPSESPNPWANYRGTGSQQPQASSDSGEPPIISSYSGPPKLAYPAAYPTASSKPPPAPTLRPEDMQRLAKAGGRHFLGKAPPEEVLSLCMPPPCVTGSQPSAASNAQPPTAASDQPPAAASAQPPAVQLTAHGKRIVEQREWEAKFAQMPPEHFPGKGKGQ